MYFMGNGSQTVYYLYKELHVRCCRVPEITLLFMLQVVSGTNIFIILLVNLGFFGIRKSTVTEVAFLDATLKF